MDSREVRVLHVIGGMDLGGAESMIMNLYRRVDREKIQFDFLVHSTKEGSFEKEITELGGRIYRIERFRGINIWNYYRQCLAFFKENPEIQIVHGHIGSSAAIYLWAAKRNKCFTIAHSHNASVGKNLHGLMYSIFSYPTRFIADQLFGCSLKAGISRYGKKAVNSIKYKTFLNAIELEKFSFDEKVRNECREMLGINTNQLLIGTIGRISEQKNPRLICEIFNYLVDKYPEVVCIWVGTGELENECKSKLKKSNRIIMTGYRKDVSTLLQAMDCFMLPSFYEGLPVIGIEAQTAGVPCVFSDTITREVDVSSVVAWENIDSSPTVWGDICVEMAKKVFNNRKTDYTSVREAGYDINETSKWLTEFYLENSISK